MDVTKLHVITKKDKGIRPGAPFISLFFASKLLTKQHNQVKRCKNLSSSSYLEILVDVIKRKMARERRHIVVLDCQGHSGEERTMRPKSMQRQPVQQTPQPPIMRPPMPKMFLILDEVEMRMFRKFHQWAAKTSEDEWANKVRSMG